MNARKDIFPFPSHPSWVRFAILQSGVTVGRAFMPAACFQQACSEINMSRPEGGCRLIARPTETTLLGFVS
jgi:hypothetical protein